MDGNEKIKLMFRGHLPAFARLAFEAVNPFKKIIPNWHIDVVGYRLTQILKGEITRLIINLPPRTLKSFLASVSFPAFVLGQDPTLKILVLAGSRELAKDLRQKTMTLMRSERYRALFDHIRVTSDQSQITLPQGGSLHFETYGQTLIGRGFDMIIVDDPQSPEDAKDPKKRREVNNYFASSIVPRLDNGSTGKIILIQQRLHRNDLTSHLQSHSGSWNTLSIPAIPTEDQSWQHTFGEHTILKGTPICALRDSLDDLRARLRSMGAEDFSAQFQQNPQRSDSRGNRYVRFVWARPPPGWDPNTGMCEHAALLIDKTDMLEEELFGGPRVFYTLIDPGTPDAEWERQAIAQQRRLSCQCNPDPSPEHDQKLKELEKNWAEVSKNNVYFPRHQENIDGRSTAI